MMSIFSSFDVLCHKMSFSMGPTNEQRPKPTDPSSVVDPMKTDREGNSAPPAHVSKPPLQQPRRPRFAPELDGVHCFETIIPY
ncbi:Regulator of telomere elongation helicase [Fagus crenata]